MAATGKTVAVLQATNYNCEIDGTRIFLLQNVSNFVYMRCRPFLNVELSNMSDSLTDIEPSVYFVFDSPGADAFVHWMFEAFLFYPLFNKIRRTYPRVKVITFNRKKYILNSFRLMGIEVEIVDRGELSKNLPNIVFFPPIICFNDNNTDTDLMRRMIDNFANDISDIIRPVESLHTRVLFLPRNSVDNNAANDHPRPGQDDIAKGVIESGGAVLNTYQINNMKIQLAMISSADIIILDYGSSYFVNCMFMKGKRIIMLDHLLARDGQVGGFKACKVMDDIIRASNEVIMIKQNQITYSDIARHLE